MAFVYQAKRNLNNIKSELPENVFFLIPYRTFLVRPRDLSFALRILNINI